MQKSIIVLVLLLSLAACLQEAPPAPVAEAKLFPIKQEGKWGFIDRQGTLVARLSPEAFLDAVDCSVLLLK